MNYSPGIFWELVKEREPALLDLGKRLIKLENSFQSITSEMKDLRSVLTSQKEVKYHEKNEKDGVESLLVKNEMKKMGFIYGKFHYVPSDYYERRLVDRRDLLNGPSVDHLCKSILIENVNHSGPETKENSRYYIICLQYISKIDYPILINSIVNLQKKKLAKSNFLFRVADNAFEITGFRHNALSAFGSKKEIPIILSSSIVSLSPGIFYLGGGHEDVKTELQVEEFKRRINPLILNCTSPKDWKCEDLELLRNYQKKYKKSPSPKENDKKEVPQNQGKKAKKPKQKKQKQKQQNKKVAFDYSNPNPHIFDIRIGKILALERVGNVLYKETIDVGEESGPRTICSGLFGKIPIEVMKDSLVLVMCNLKPSKMAGVMSNGMILVASTENTHDLPKLPEGVQIGDKISFEGIEEVDSLNRIPPKKVKSLIVPFRSNEEKYVCFGNYKLKVANGYVLSEKANSNVS